MGISNDVFAMCPYYLVKLSVVLSPPNSTVPVLICLFQFVSNFSFLSDYKYIVLLKIANNCP